MPTTVAMATPRNAPTADVPSTPDVRSLLADLAVRIAQLDWPVACDVEGDADGREAIVMRRVDPSAPLPASNAGTFRVGSGSLGQPGLIDAILDELRARGWDRSPAPGLVRDDVRWCAPA